MSTTPETIAESLAKETHQKRRRIAGSLWPRARLIGEILYHQITSNQIFTQASALTYKTLFSLLPIFVLSLLVLSAISAGDGKNALDSAVKNVLFEQMGLNHMTIQLEDPTTQSTPATATEPIAREPREMRLDAFIDPFIQRAKSSVSGKTTGLVAFAILLYGAISLMIVIEGTFNQIYGSVRPRSWPRRIMLYWCVLTLGPIGIAGSIALGNSALSAAQVIGVTIMISVAKVFSGFLVSWILILLLYRIVPDTRVNWRPAIVGSFIAALAWEIGKWAFGLYVQRAVRSSWYGSMALLPLFMFWIYITWTLVLIGLEITYIQQYWSLLKRRFFFARATLPGAPVIADLRWVLTLGIFVFRNFRAGKMTHVHEASEALTLPNDVVHLLLEAMEKAGIVHETQPGSYALARPADAITADDLLASARALCEVPPELSKDAPQTAGAPGLLKFDEIERQWARSTHLAALAGDLTSTGDTNA